MNFLIHDTRLQKAGSAIKLLFKYAKVHDSDRTAVVSFAEEPDCSGDSYRISVNGDSICIYANTIVGFQCGAGYLLRHQHERIDNQDVLMSSDFRAVYFATHFFNYYHEAPIDEIGDYLESLALWGQNTLCIWFDMHHFASLSDREAQEMIERCRRLFAKAKALGMKTSLTHLANEYYKGAPGELLAQNSTESGKYFRNLCGYFGTELCPSNTEGEVRLLSSFDALLTCFAEVGVDYIMLWPYDQGGCTCDACYPWGGGGFFRIAKKKAEIARQHFPEIRIIYSCWMFDAFTNGEWDAALDAIQGDGDWIDALMVNIHSPLPQRLSEVSKPIVSFPDISMVYACPWGGFGGNPYPRLLSQQFQNSRSLVQGGALYSEGIFEDINKAVSLELMRDASLDPKQIVREYCAYHFSPDCADAMTDIIMRMETTLPRRTLVGGTVHCDFPSGKPVVPHTYELLNPDAVQGIAHDMLTVDRMLPDEIRNSWRYRQIYLRAVGDLALIRNHGVPNAETDAIYAELADIYHARNAFYFVAPITRKSIMENRGNGNGV